jgi:hypothetical protein
MMAPRAVRLLDRVVTPDGVQIVAAVQLRPEPGIWLRRPVAADCCEDVFWSNDAVARLEWDRTARQWRAA